MIFGKKSTKEEKLPAPKEIPTLVQNHLVTKMKMQADLARLLKAAIRRNGESAFNIRIFDDSEAAAKRIEVKDYTSLDEHPDLTLYEGVFDEGAKQVNLAEKKTVNYATPILSLAEIQQKIEALTEPGSTVFFYMARGPNHGGPLAMGATVVELNPTDKGKKYIVYTSDVIDMQPVGKGQKLFDNNKAKDVAKWIKDGHGKRQY